MRKIPIFLITLFICAQSHPVCAKRTFRFNGAIDVDQRLFQLHVASDQEETVRIDIHPEGNNQIRIACDLEHMKTRFFDLSTELQARVELPPKDKQAQGPIIGTLRSQYTLLDYKPTRECASRFEIKKGDLIIHAFHFANVTLKGFVELAKPYRHELNFGIYDMHMEDFLDIWMKNRKSAADGLVSGQINLSGDLQRFFMKGVLESQTGFIKKLHFKNIRLEAEGYYPNLEVTRMLLTKLDGSPAIITGFVDLSDKENFLRQIKSLRLAPDLKDDAAEAEWTIKRLDSDDAGNIELRYLIRGKDDASFTDEQGSDMLGVQRVMEF